MPAHPTTQPVANFLVEAAEVSKNHVVLIPYSVTNYDNPLALATSVGGGHPWMLEPDSVKHGKLLKLSYVRAIWQMSFPTWCDKWRITHKNPDPTKQVKVHNILLDINSTMSDYTLAWQFLRIGGTMAGIVHSSLAGSMKSWTSSLEKRGHLTEYFPFPHELNMTPPYWWVRATKENV